MISNDTGNVAITYYQNTNKRIRVSETDYIFNVKKNVNLAWINPQHVAQIFAIRKSCCGGNRNQVFRYSSEQEVRIWQYGAER